MGFFIVIFRDFPMSLLHSSILSVVPIHSNQGTIQSLRLFTSSTLVTEDYARKSHLLSTVVDTESY